MSTTTTNQNNPPNTSHHHHPHSVKGVIDHLTNDAYFGEEIDFIIGLTATALTADQVLKLRNSKHHKAAHLAKAGLGAVAATTAFTMMAKEHNAEKKHRAELKAQQLESLRGRLRQRPRDLEAGYAESLADSDSEDERYVRERRVVEYRRGTSVQDGEYGYGRRGYDRSRSPSRSRSRSRSRTRSPSRAATARRAVSHSPVRPRERRSNSYPRLTKFVEAVRDALEEQQQQNRR